MLKRKTVRQKCIVDARLYFDGEPAIDCSIDDITPEGARLIVERPVPRPMRKILIFIPSIGAVWAANIRWRRGQSLGLEFIPGEADLAGTTTASDPKVFALRMQCAQLSNTAKRIEKRIAASSGKTRGSTSAVHSPSPEMGR